MTGPSLRKKNSHHSIHDGIYTEARDLTRLLKKVMDEKQEQPLNEIADALIEHWETRTLAHADSEEEGLFVEVLEEKPDLKEMITKLKRDHQLMHRIVAQIKIIVHEDGITEDVLRHFDALLVLFQMHNLEEEENIFIEGG